MDPQEFAGDYFADEADLEGSLDLPILGHLESEARFYQRQEGLTGLTPDPRLSERLHYFVEAEQPAVWVVGLGQAGEELPVAVGLAERAAEACAPVLVIGPEAERPLGMAPLSLRPVEPGAFGDLLAALFPRGCGAQASGIQGVFRAWPGGDDAEECIVPGGLVIASHATSDSLVPSHDMLSGVVLVVPYRDEPARAIVEQVTKLRDREYPLLGIVVVTAPGLIHGRPDLGIAPPGDITADELAAEADGEGGIMNEGGSERVAPPGQENVNASPQEEPTSVAAQDAPLPDAEQERVAAQSTWSDSFGSPGGRKRRERGARGRIPWWVTVIVLVAVGGAGLMITRMLRVERADDFAGDEMTVVAPDEPVAVVSEDAAIAEIPAGETAVPMEASEPVLTEVSEPAPTHVPAAEETPPRPHETHPQPRAPETPAVRPMSGENVAPYGLQCGAYRSATGAEREASRLRTLGLDARVVAVSFPERGVLHRIVIGRWENLGEARALAGRAIAEGWLREAVVVADDGAGPAIGAPIKAQ